MKIEFSDATSSEVHQISKLVNSAYRGEESKAGWTTEADFFEGFRTTPEILLNDLAVPKNKIICGHDVEGCLVCCVFLQKTDSGDAYLGMLTVQPNLQGRGIAKNLLQKAEDTAREWGSRRMILGVINVRDTLMNWYERRGYRKFGTEAFPKDDPSLSGIKIKNPYFVMFEKQLV